MFWEGWWEWARLIGSYDTLDPYSLLIYTSVSAPQHGLEPKPDPPPLERLI